MQGRCRKPQRSEKADAGWTAKIETENDGKTAGNAFEINCDRVRTPAERTLAFEAARLQ
ncbi:hypothetical protein OOO56_003317 [Salmonella enterica]|nr:hypothetical protein [Salmonella enterica]